MRTSEVFRRLKYRSIKHLNAGEFSLVLGKEFFPPLFRGNVRQKGFFCFRFYIRFSWREAGTELGTEKLGGIGEWKGGGGGGVGARERGEGKETRQKCDRQLLPMRKIRTMTTGSSGILKNKLWVCLWFFCLMGGISERNEGC